MRTRQGLVEPVVSFRIVHRAQVVPSRASAISCERSTRFCSKDRNDGNDTIVHIGKTRKGVISVPDSMIRICRHQ